MMDARQTGQIIASLRKEKQLTQKELAERLHISSAAVSKWERGLNFPDLLLLEPLADILETTPSQILCLENEPAETVLSSITILSKEERVQNHAKRKMRLCLLLSALTISIILFRAFLFLGRDTPENNALLGKYSFQNITILPLWFGLCSWGFGIAALLSYRHQQGYKNCTILSFGFCIIALYLVILIFDFSLRLGNFASLDDTAWGYHFSSMALLIGTIIVNFFAWLASKGKAKDAPL